MAGFLRQTHDNIMAKGAQTPGTAQGCARATLSGRDNSHDPVSTANRTKS